MPDALSRWKLAALVAAGLVVASCPVHLLREALRAPAPRSAVAAEATFVGREACARCHEKESRAWTGSHHDQAMTEASEATVRGDFSGVRFEGDGMRARFFRRDGKFLVETAGPDGPPTEFEVAYTFGWKPLQQYLIRFPGGRLQAFSVAWDTEKRRWFFLYPGRQIPPGDWLHWTRNGQNWNGMCAECHSTNLVKSYDPKSDSYATTWSEVDVSCEACHGPGSRHVAWAEVPPMGRAALANTGLVMRTSGIDNRALVELCAPCHSRRTELGDYDHRRSELLDNHLPVLLAEGIYHPDGQILDEDFEYGSFVQSKMFRMGVRCTDCHDAHSLKLRQEGNGVCLQCHAAPAYDDARHHFHQKQWQGRPSDGALCVSCHMPKSPFMVVHWRADHSLRIPRPDLTIATDPRAVAAVIGHPERGVVLLADVAFLQDALPAIRHHHERWDGTGFPDGLAGERIPLGARIIAAADAFDSLTRVRPAQPAWPTPNRQTAARSRKSRLMALTTALSEAVTIEELSPTPHSTWESSPSPTSVST